LKPHDKKEKSHLQVRGDDEGRASDFARSRRLRGPRVFLQTPSSKNVFGAPTTDHYVHASHPFYVREDVFLPVLHDPPAIALPPEPGRRQARVARL
jgi:hypothetical protein